MSETSSSQDPHRCEPEELPPLELHNLRDLTVDRPEDSERPPHMASASGIVRRGDFAYVIGDDELDLGIFRLSGDEPGKLERALPGDIDPDAPWKDKPDLEALTALPPFDGGAYGGLLGVGSGSNDDRKRDRGFFWPFAADGSLEGESTVIDLNPMYELLRKELGAINIEGAAVFGDHLWLFNRGNDEGGKNAVAELRMSDLAHSLRGDEEIDADELDALRTYELGELGGVELSFSDATPLFDQLVVFTASAEGEDDILGSVVGTIDGSGEVRRMRTIDKRWKVEGVHAAVDTGVIEFTFVCDQDEPETPSPLLIATMPIDSRYEKG
ncbi:hypothetical protein HJD18_16970 [Thermoleophilia bacterium SCSIO 60948]|nr:hypothetical protein HJD18_16970 [Thermoleophilia bacterium SCSIO 60948]